MGHQHIFWETRKTHRPTQGVRQRLRDLLRNSGVTELFRIDRRPGQRGTLIVTSAKHFPELPFEFEKCKVIWHKRDHFELNYEERLLAQRHAEVAGVVMSTDLIFKQFQQEFGTEFDDSYRAIFFHCLVFGKQAHRQEGFLVSTVDEAMAIICKRMPQKVICGRMEVLTALAGKRLPVVGNSWYEDNIFLVMRRQTTEELRKTAVST